ncbi:hypothetical protein BFC17_04975 [Alteromonas lipolytica]|uniref:Uncharacterized protein n=2 Tax=Alteromonas lipolytica TaxID=1856405 RepID=A0A1E8F9C5_9ALTE|nr:hypothetical protein BFC17_04975 [Alteromonas lipolytica]
MSRGGYRCLLALSGLALVGMFFLIMQPGITWLLTLSLATLLLALYWPIGHKQQPVRWMLAESGRGRNLAASALEQQDNWQICARSKLLPYAIYVVRFHAQSRCYESCWVMPWQTSDTSYRRLARIVYRQGLQ